jgi:hypothetical protein
MATIFKPLSESKANHQICPSFRLHQIINGAIPKQQKKPSYSFHLGLLVEILQHNPETEMPDGPVTAEH